MTSMKRIIAMVRMRYIRGGAWLQAFISMGVIAANAKLYEDFFKVYFGIGVGVAIIVLSVGYVFMCYLIGWVDEKKGIWKHENDYAYEVSPLAYDMSKQIRALHDEFIVNKKKGS